MSSTYQTIECDAGSEIVLFNQANLGRYKFKQCIKIKVYNTNP